MDIKQPQNQKPHKHDHKKGKARQAIDWFRSKTGLFAKQNPLDIGSGHGRYVQKPHIGHMVMFQYDPKHKATLPYYDTFPLIFAFREDAHSFTGINLHYLDPKRRAGLLDALMGIANNQEYDHTTKLRISWQVLQNFSASAEVRPCVKMYLKTHVRSRYIRIRPEEWTQVMLLPLARFKKMNQQSVWMESSKIIKKIKK